MFFAWVKLSLQCKIASDVALVDAETSWKTKISAVPTHSTLKINAESWHFDVRDEFKVKITNSKKGDVSICEDFEFSNKTIVPDFVTQKFYTGFFVTVWYETEW